MEKIFEELYRRDYKNALGMGIAKLRVVEDAEDAVQAAFMRLWKTLQKRAIDNPRGYFYMILRNEVIDTYRRRATASLHPTKSLDFIAQDNYAFVETVPDPDQSSDQMSILTEACEGILPALSHLERQVIIGLDYEGHKPKSLGEKLGMSGVYVSVVKNRAQKKIQMLRDEWRFIRA